MKINQGALVGQRLGKYELLALLAVGGTAEIYLARIGGEAGFEKYVVVKCLLDHLADESDYVKMFLDEARLGAQLDHSNIVQTLELGEHEGRFFMAMEYLAGMSLAQLARKTNQRVQGGKMPTDLVLGLAAQTCAGLHYAHRKPTTSGQPLNLIHRDISPQNLVVSFDGILKIVDFGIAKADVRDTHTRNGTIKGKFAYMSPEQCQAKEIDHRTDIFALGVILHELLTARRLFKRTTTYETYEAIIKGDVPLPSSLNGELGPEIDTVVMRALKYKKEDRYASAEELGQALLGTLHKRGKLINASDIAANYELHFGAELKEHRDQMRQLITGKRATAVGEESVNWGTADAEEAISEITIDPDGSMVESIESIEERASVDNQDQPTLPEGATRIETNPLTISKVIDGVKTEVSGGSSPTTTDSNSPMVRSAHERDGQGAVASGQTGGHAGHQGAYRHGALASNRTIVPGGIAPLPRASEFLAGNKGQIVSGVAERGKPAARPMTSGPSAKTIAPGQLSLAKPSANLVPSGKDGNENPMLNQGLEGRQHALAPERQQPRRTVMGVAALKQPGERSANAPAAQRGEPQPGFGSAKQAGNSLAAKPTKMPRPSTVPPPTPAPASSSARTLFQVSPNDAQRPQQNSPPQTSVPPDTMPPIAEAHQRAMAGAAGPRDPTIAPGHGPIGAPQAAQAPQAQQPLGHAPQQPLGHAPQQPLGHAPPRHRPLGPQQPTASPRPQTHGQGRPGTQSGPMPSGAWQPTTRMGRDGSDNSRRMLLGLVFALSLGVGLGITLLISSLV